MADSRWCLDAVLFGITLRLFRSWILKSPACSNGGLKMVVGLILKMVAWQNRPWAPLHTLQTICCCSHSVHLARYLPPVCNFNTGMQTNKSRPSLSPSADQYTYRSNSPPNLAIKIDGRRLNLLYKSGQRQIQRIRREHNLSYQFLRRQRLNLQLHINSLTAKVKVTTTYKTTVAKF